MPNGDPFKARMAKKLKSRTGNIADVKRKLWVALLHAEDVLEKAGEHEPDLRLRASHAVSQISGQMLKAIEVGELEVRLARLEAQQKAQQP